VSPKEWQLPTPIRTPLYQAEEANLYPGAVEVFTWAGIQYVAEAAANITLHPEIGTFRITPTPVGQAVAASYHYGFPSTIGAGPYDRRILGQRLSPTEPVETLVTGGGALPAVPVTGTITIADSLTYTPAGDAAGLKKTTIRSANRLRPLIGLAANNPWTLAAAGNSELYLEGMWLSGGDIVLSGAFDMVRITCCTLDPGNSGQGLKPPAVFESNVQATPLIPTRLWVEGSIRTLTIDRSVLGPIRTRNGGDIENLTITNSTVQGIRTEDFANFVDLEDPARLAARLHDQNDPVAAWLWGQLKPLTQADITAYVTQVGPPPLAQVSADIISEVNAVINSGASIYDAKRFALVEVDPLTLSTAKAPPPGTDLVRLNRILLEDAFPTELADLALGSTTGTVQLTRCTVLGPSFVHRLEASECVLDDRMLVEDNQHGCVRFTAWTTGSVLPQQYESVEIPPGAPIFTSRDFGQPGYCQLRTDADRAILAGGPRPSITEGGPTGSEIGVYAREMNAIKRKSLLIKFQEFMPLGLSPVVVDVT
jgi:hypothetical protein